MKTYDSVNEKIQTDLTILYHFYLNQIEEIIALGANGRHVDCVEIIINDEEGSESYIGGFSLHELLPKIEEYDPSGLVANKIKKTDFQRNILIIYWRQNDGLAMAVHPRRQNDGLDVDPRKPASDGQHKHRALPKRTVK